MMIGTVLVRPQALADLEAVELRQHDVEHDEVDRLRRRSARAPPRRRPPGRPCSRRARAGSVSTFRTAASSSTSRIVEESTIGSARRPRCCSGSCSYYSPPMAAPQPPARRRRRPRRGSLERPVNGRLYRASFLVVLLPLLLLLAFTVTKPVALQAPTLPPAFDAQRRARAGPRARDAVSRTARRASSGALGAATWFRDKLALYDLPTRTRRVARDGPGPRQACSLQNVMAVVAGQSPDVIVVMAHRDDTGDGPGANDNASGTAALLELARAYARPAVETPGGGAADAHARLPLHRRRRVRRPRRASLRQARRDRGPGRRGAQPRRARRARAAARRDRRRPAALAGDDPRRRPRRGGSSSRRGQRARASGRPRAARRPRLPVHALRAGAVRRARDPRDHADERRQPARRPPSATAPGRLDTPRARASSAGRRRRLLGSLDQGLELAQGTTSYVWFGDRIVRGWAIELVLIALLVPFFVAVVDLFALCRRQRIGARGRRRARCARGSASGSSSGSFSRVFARSGRGRRARRARRTPRPPPQATGTCSPLSALLVIAFAGWLVARRRLVPRREVSRAGAAGRPHRRAARARDRRAARRRDEPVRAALPAARAPRLALAAAGAHGADSPVRLAIYARRPRRRDAIVLVSLAWRFGLGLDAPWYLLDARLGRVREDDRRSLIALAATAAGAQLAAAAAGRYAPVSRAASEERPRRPGAGRRAQRRARGARRRAARARAGARYRAR